MHRFQAALRIGTKDYSVKLTVKEFEDGKLRVDNHLLNSIATGWKRKCPLVTPTARGFPWLAGPQRAFLNSCYVPFLKMPRPARGSSFCRSGAD